MTGRQRVRAAMDFKSVDIAPLQCFYVPVGYYEHGEKAQRPVFHAAGGFRTLLPAESPPRPGPECYEADGSYHAFERDEWGTLARAAHLRRLGHPLRIPAGRPRQLDSFRPPEPPKLSGPEFDALCEANREHKKQYYKLHHTGSLLERMCALRRDADVLCDIALDEPDIHRMADMILDRSAAEVQLAIKSDADGVAFGDDYGTERGLLMSPEMWRRFFKPRLARLFKPAREAGLDVVFHSCGKLMELLPDLSEVGATAIWPQLPAYNMAELAARCRELGLAVAVHTDRANAMTYGTPREVRGPGQAGVRYLPHGGGGSWFYVEADNGFPFANMEALVGQISEYRNIS